MVERNRGAALMSVALVVAGAGVAQADVIDTQSITLGAEKTNWTRSLTIPQIEASVATLTKVTLVIEASIASTYRLENLQTRSSEQFLKLNGLIEVRRNDNSLLGSGGLNYERSDVLAPYDGAFDFAGASSLSTNFNDDFETVVVELTSASDLAMFEGSGTITMPVNAAVSSFFQGPSNVARSITTLAEANVRVIYEGVPIPGPAALSVLSLGVLATTRRRRG